MFTRQNDSLLFLSWHDLPEILNFFSRGGGGGLEGVGKGIEEGGVWM